MRSLILAIALLFVSCRYIQPDDTQQQDQKILKIEKTPPFNENEVYEETTAFVTDTMAATIEQWIEWTKKELEKVGQLDNAARERILKNLKNRIKKYGNLSDTEADAFVEKVSPQVERLIRAFISGNKVEIALASISVLAVVIPFIIVIIRRRRKNKQ